jgi:aromatic ring-cleaving dioxygenase
MTIENAPYHAHIYYEAGSREAAARLREQLAGSARNDDPRSVVFVGEMRDMSVGPHPKPQFEIHFRKHALPNVLALIGVSGLTALVHPLTDDDLADHTLLATWIGDPLPLDQSVLDPPGRNQGIARFGKSDF